MKMVAFCLALMSATALWAEKIPSSPSAESEHAVSIFTNLSSGVMVWTNDYDVPVVLKAVRLQSLSGTNTAVISRTRLYDEDVQRVGSVVQTNEFDEVVTNYYSQVTNVTASISSNTVASATFTNSQAVLSINAPVAERRLVDYEYTFAGDVWYVLWGATNSRAELHFSR